MNQKKIVKRLEKHARQGGWHLHDHIQSAITAIARAQGENK